MKIFDNLTPEMADFLRSHHVMTLATALDGVPWCAQCFYLFVPQWNALVFTSDRDTRHAIEALRNPVVAGSILLETEAVGKIQGIQLTGILEVASGSIASEATLRYLKRFPYALLSKSTMWILRMQYVKMTDNRFGFGKKQIWKAADF
ncbi:MAG: pyridoxamine 5'-phosphate oxidase family protein [Bacteroidales bacterium]